MGRLLETPDPGFASVTSAYPTLVPSGRPDIAFCREKLALPLEPLLGRVCSLAVATLPQCKVSDPVEQLGRIRLPGDTAKTSN